MRYIERCEERGIEQSNKYTAQKFIPEKLCSPHPRFLGLAMCIKERRGCKVEIKVPIFEDERTNLTEATEAEPFPGQIYMDSMHFGMGCACLQLTYESQNINHARFLYDMFLPWTPIMSVLSASTPLLKGQISDHDFRWEVIEQSTDCRTPDEKDPNSINYIPKSRYSTVSRYISNHQYVKNFHNDVNFRKLCAEVRLALIREGLDERLADHIAQLFIREPIPVYEPELAFPTLNNSPKKGETCDCAASPLVMQHSEDTQALSGPEEAQKAAADDQTSFSSFPNHCQSCYDMANCSAHFLRGPALDGNAHFENVQSTNWNSLRFKNPPTEDSKIGWRVEFRPMDIQLTDFENSALAIAVGMINNIINTFDLDFVLPISLVDENMKRAHNRNGLLQTKFWWKVPLGSEAAGPTRLAVLRDSNFLSSNPEYVALGSPEEQKAEDEARYAELYVWQILNGDESIGFTRGLIPMCHELMQLKQWPEQEV